MRRKALNNINNNITSYMVKDSIADTISKKNANETILPLTEIDKSIKKSIDKNNYQVVTKLPLDNDIKKVLKKALSKDRLWHSVEV